MKVNSSLRFRDFVLEFDHYYKIIWNGREIYNDEYDTVDKSFRIDVLYGNKIVYEMNTKVVDFHHCELTVIGENDEEEYQEIRGKKDGTKK